MSRRVYLLIVIFVALAAGSSSAWAQGEVGYPNRVAGHIRHGNELFEAGSYTAAQEELKIARDLLKTSEPSQRMRVDYLLAECSARIGANGDMEYLEAFLEEYPNSIYDNDVRFAMANLLYANGDHKRALEEYAKIDRFDLRTSQQDEYSFKQGHSHFVLEDFAAAASSLKQVDKRGEYGVHAKYYMAYMDYIGGNYAAAKREFVVLKDEATYQRVIPFYLLQIEFLEGNYDYVAREGEALLAVAKGERVAEIARMMGEAWFHKKDFESALRYMKSYREAGGEMGRAEEYLVGYSQYMRNDVGDAIESLSRVTGADDKLTQNAAYHLGGCYLRTGDKVKAMQSFSMAAGAGYDPEIREDALFNYGKLQYELGGGVFNEAINLLNRYIAEYPKSPRIDQAREYLVAAYYNSRNYQAAYDAIKLMSDPDNNVRTAYQKIAYFRALEFYNAGDHNRAYTTLEESLRNKFNPKYTALTQFWKGEILFGQGQYEQAIPLYKEYVALSPSTEQEYGMALYNLGYCYFNQKEWGEARTWFTKLLTGHKSSMGAGYVADAYNRLGDAQYVVRDFSKALANYDAGAKLGTNERFYSQYQYAVTLGLTGSKTRKIDALRKIIADAQGDYVDDAMYELGRTYIAMDRFSDGAAVLKRLVAEYPSSDKQLDALSDLGLAYQNMNDNKSALSHYKTLVDRAPNSVQARDAMTAVKSIYIDMNDVDGYFAFAGKSGIETDMGAMSRDSLSFVAAEKMYMMSSNRNTIISSLKGYLDKFPRGVYRANTLSYLADSYVADGQIDAAIGSLKELSQMYFNSFTVKGLERLATMNYAKKSYADAADAYKKLTSVAVNPETTSKAWEGYMKSVVATGDDGRILAATDEIIATAGVPAAVVKDAKFNKAGVLARKGDKAGALRLYKELATEVESAQGAESTYYVIEALYENGDFTAAERKILDFAKQNSTHSYWLAKSFLTLGDIYIGKGDTFQARATLQSVVDGYSPANDGIVAAARERINSMK